MNLPPAASEVRPPDPKRLVLLTNAAMRARRRPLAILVLWAYELVLAAAITWPASSYVNAAYGGHPQGDAPLFRPGALALADLVFRARPVASALSAHASPLFGLGLVLGLLPLAMLIVEIAHATAQRKAPPLKAAAARAWGIFPRFFGLFLLVSVVEAFLFVMGVVLGGATSGATAHSLGEARSQQLGAVVFLVLLALAAVAGVVQDVARTAAVRFDVGVISSLRLALNALRRGFVATVWSWGWRAAIGWIPVIVAAMVSVRLDGRSGSALFALTVIHQMVVLARVALRASWLAKALRLVDNAHQVVRSPVLATLDERDERDDDDLAG